MVEGFPAGFIGIMLGLFALALIVTVIAFSLKQRKAARLKNPHRDFYR